MWNKGFEGWYFKHQLGDDVIALIPGRAKSGAFVQVLLPDGARQFDVPRLTLLDGVIQAGGCRFSQQGCRIDLPGITGALTYGPVTPLRSDIMGPFRFFPMECRHGVISMDHAVSGSLTIDGSAHCFDGGRGYIEKDSGTSFPSAYLWLQCNDFSQPCSVMASIARIPFCGGRFTGCICAVVHRGREYRLATYNGVCILAAEAEHIRLSQGGLLLDAEIRPAQGGHPLRAPIRGTMSGAVRESNNVRLRLRLWDNGKPILDACSSNAAYEFVSFL